MLGFDPFRDIDRVTQQLLGAGTARAPRYMPMDVYRSGDHYVLHADLPGVDPGSIDVQIDSGVLTIRAERSPRPDDAGEWLASERVAGTLQRRVTIGDDLDPEKVGATYDNGVLTVTLPIAERAKPRRITVEGAAAPPATIEASNSEATADAG